MSTDSNPTNRYSVPAVSIATAQTGASSKLNALGMRPMQERAYAKRGEQYLLIKSPPASGKSRALMFIALDKIHNQGAQASHHRGARALDWGQLRQRKPDSSWLLGGLVGAARAQPL